MCSRRSELNSKLKSQRPTAWMQYLGWWSEAKTGTLSLVRGRLLCLTLPITRKEHSVWSESLISGSSRLGILIQPFSRMIHEIASTMWVSEQKRDQQCVQADGPFHNGFDPYSKYVFAFSAYGALASATNQGLRKSLIHKHGTQHKIVLDQETHYIAKEVRSRHMTMISMVLSYAPPSTGCWIDQSTGNVCWRSSWCAILERMPCAEKHYPLRCSVHLKLLNIICCRVFKL